MDLTLVVLAAGLSTRYGEGFKQIDAVGPSGEWLVDYGVFDAIRAGFTHVVFVARPEIERALRDRVATLPRPVSSDIVFQRLDDLPDGRHPPASRRKPWGTGQALLAAAPVVRAPFAVVNADDFYGAEAYQAMADWLRRARWTAPHPAAMIGYRLRETLSPHGSVSRAICEPGPHDDVRRVSEVLDIAEREGRIRGRDMGGTDRDLTGDELASMNFWGFQPPVFGMLRVGFARFLDARGNDPAAEFLLSSAVNELIAAGEITLEALSPDARWCGMTSSADRDAVAARLRQLSARGDYPTPLFPL
jgi:hypothetical protein